MPCCKGELDGAAASRVRFRYLTDRVEVSLGDPVVDQREVLGQRIGLEDHELVDHGAGVRHVEGDLAGRRRCRAQGDLVFGQRSGDCCAGRGWRCSRAARCQGQCQAGECHGHGATSLHDPASPELPLRTSVVARCGHYRCMAILAGRAERHLLVGRSSLGNERGRRSGWQHAHQHPQPGSAGRGPRRLPAPISRTARHRRRLGGDRPRRDPYQRSRLRLPDHPVDHHGGPLPGGSGRWQGQPVGDAAALS